MGHELDAALLHMPIWLSVSVESTAVTSARRDEPLMDWRIVASPPLHVCNLLPLRASFLVWEQPQV